jgi:hypothetical protein
MGDWFRNLRDNWDAVLALGLAWLIIALYLGPAYYFIGLFVLGCVYIIRYAVKRW